MNNERVRKQKEPTDAKNKSATFPLLIFREKSDQCKNKQPVKGRNKEIQEFGQEEKHGVKIKISCCRQRKPGKTNFSRDFAVIMKNIL
jgi:hypothetical protein